MPVCDNGAPLTSEPLSEDEGGVWERRSLRRAAAATSTSASFRPSSNQVCDTLTEHLSLYHTAQAKQGEERERERERERMASGGNRTYDLVMADADTPLLYSCRERYAGCGSKTLCFTELGPEKASTDLFGRRVDRGCERDGNREGTKETR